MFGQIAGLLRTGIPSVVQAAWPTLNNPAAGQAPGAVVGRAFSARSKHQPPQGTPVQWSFTAQHTFGKHIAVEAGHVGNVGAWEAIPTTLPTGLPPGNTKLSPVNVLTPARHAAHGITGAKLSIRQLLRSVRDGAFRP